MKGEKQSFEIGDIFMGKDRVSVISIIRKIPGNIKKNWIPILVMIFLWIFPDVLKSLGINNSFLKPLNFLTAGNIGMNTSNWLHIAGGTASKTIVLAVLVSYVIPVVKKITKGNYSFNLKRAKNNLIIYKNIFKGGLSSLSWITAGIGIAFVLHNFLSVDGSFSKSFTSIIAAFYGLKTLGNRSPKVKKIMLGGSLGFLATVPVAILINNSNISYIIGGVLAVAGFAIAIFSGKNKKQIKRASAIILLIFMTFSQLPFYAFAQDDIEGVDVEISDYIYGYEPFEIKIKIDNPDVKKYCTLIRVDTFDSQEFQIVSGPEIEESDGFWEGITYKGEDEVTFIAQLNETVEESRKLDIRISFSYYYFDEDYPDGGTWADWPLFLIVQPVTQVPTKINLELPKGYDFIIEYPAEPYTSGFVARNPYTEITSEKYPNVSWAEDYNITTGQRYFSSKIHSVEERLENYFRPPYTEDWVNREYFELSNEDVAMDVESAGYVVYKENEENFQDGEIIISRGEAIVQMAMVKGVMIFLVNGEYRSAVYETSVVPLLDEKVEEMVGLFKGFNIEPSTTSVPTYERVVEVFGFPEEEVSLPVDTENTVVANEEESEMPPLIPEAQGAIAITLGSSIFAAAAAGIVASGSQEAYENRKDKRRKEYQMVISKTAGSKVRSDEHVTFYAGIYERIYEEDGSITEGMNSELSSLIQFSSPEDYVKFSESEIIDNTKAVNFAAESNKEGKKQGDTCTITCYISGAGGSHKQNVIFELAGDPYIELGREKYYILTGSGEEYSFKFRPLDFLENIEKISVESMQSEIPFDVRAEKKKDEWYLKVIEKGSVKKNFEEFFENYNCEMITENSKEKARVVFDIVACREGIVPDFLGKEKEIRGYKVSLESDEMEKTRFKVRAGVWNEKEGTLDFITPENIEVDLQDEEEIFDLIGMKVQIDEELSTDDGVSYFAQAEKNLPALDAVEGKMTLKGSVEEKTFDNEIDIKLIPDELQYYADFEKEYIATKKVIEVYMAERFREKKLKQLEEAKNDLGLEDFRLFRKTCWDIAEQSIMQEKQEYIMEEAWYDEAIATAELVVYIGDIAFDLALAPIGGPIAGFLATNVKSSLLELYGIYVESPNKSSYDLTLEFVTKRIEQASGSADGLIQMPGIDEPRKLTVWLSSYVIYRIGFHWYFDKDENQQPIGIAVSIERGLMDFVGKGAGALLGDFLNKSAKGRWAEKISITEMDQNFVNENVSKVTEKGKDAVEKFVEILMKYLDSLRG
ncbi:MAG: hypothetical protein SCJ93_10795 [Bacillota bacterium]|nr:hypothetical protein [Bacillota bacterium]